MSEKKITKKEWFAELTKLVEVSEHSKKEEMLAFINHEVELLSKKSSGKPTKTQLENEQIKVEIKNALAEIEKPATVTEIMAHIPVSNQKLSALLRQLMSVDEVVRTEVKGKAFFSLA